MIGRFVGQVVGIVDLLVDEFDRMHAGTIEGNYPSKKK